jgi:hypothetical protein
MSKIQEKVGQSDGGVNGSGHIMDKYLDKNEEIEINNAIEKLSNIGINLADTQGEREFYKIGFRDGFEYQKNKSSENPETVKKISKDLP